MNIGTPGLNSATMVSQWNQSSAALNKQKLNPEVINQAVTAEIPTSNKVNLLLQLIDKDSKTREGSKYMLENSGMFSHFIGAMGSFKRAINSNDLGFVETGLQNQIEVVRNMQIPHEKKSLLVYTLDNMIDGLSFCRLKNGVQSDYVTYRDRSLSQMLLKGSEQGLNWDKMLDSVSTSEFSNPSDPVLAKYRYRDLNLVKQNLENMARLRPNNYVESLADLRNDTYDPFYDDEPTPVSNGVVNYGIVDLQRTTDKDVIKILNKAMDKFSKEDLKKNPSALFNFVKDSFSSNDVSSEQNEFLHKTVLSFMRLIVDFGHDMQNKQVNNTKEEERTL